MTISPITLSSVLYSQYNLEKGNSIASLLGSSTDSTQLQQTLLSGVTGGQTKQVTDSTLTEFVKEFAPENLSLLSDIAAVEALGNLFAEDAPASSSFFNAYAQVLLQSQQTLDVDESISLLV